MSFISYIPEQTPILFHSGVNKVDCAKKENFFFNNKITNDLSRPEKECPELPDPDNGQVHLTGRNFQVLLIDILFLDHLDHPGPRSVYV